MTAQSIRTVNGLRGRKRVEPNPSIKLVAGDELDRRILEGWEEWCEIAEELTAVGGTLPSPQLAGRVLRFFEAGYWRAEEAHAEQIRRELGPGQLGTQSPEHHQPKTGLVL